MKEYWMNLSASERRTLTIAGVVLAMILVYALVWQPVMSSAQEWRDKVKDKEAFVVWMNNAAQEAKQLRQSAKVRPGGSRQSLLAFVDQMARRSKLGPALKRVEPKGANEVRVRLEQASFDDVMGWLTQLQKNRSVGVESISIDRDDQPGLVSATLTLKGSS